ncbi:MAG: thioredoxin domain-containing protein [Robiginitomaculum sp.]
MGFKTFGLSFLGAGALMLTACSDAPTAELTATPMKASKAAARMDGAQAAQVKAKAVMIYADWCSSCKVLEPKVTAVRTQYEARGLEFVVLDYTQKDKALMHAQAKQNGVEIAMHDALGPRIKTGQLILVSADGKHVLGTINMGHTKAEIAEKFEAAIQ